MKTSLFPRVTIASNGPLSAVTSVVPAAVPLLDQSW